MAEVVDSIPPRKNGKEKYPWEQWFDGRAWRITRGTDFDVEVAVMRQNIWQAARTRGLAVETRRYGDALYIKMVVR
jgi:hypothetical protein